MGFGRTFQNVGMVKSATVLENLKTAQHATVGYAVLTGLAGSGAASRRGARSSTEQADGDPRPARPADHPRHPGRRPVLRHAQAARARLRARHRPRHPAARRADLGHGPGGVATSSASGCSTLRREFGLTMLVIEHHVPLVLRVCDHVYVLNFGRLLAEGKPSVIQTHPEVVAAYLGGEAPDALAADARDRRGRRARRRARSRAHRARARRAADRGGDPAATKAAAAQEAAAPATRRTGAKKAAAKKAAGQEGAPAQEGRRRASAPARRTEGRGRREPARGRGPAHRLRLAAGAPGHLLLRRGGRRPRSCSA